MMSNGPRGRTGGWRPTQGRVAAFPEADGLAFDLVDTTILWVPRPFDSAQGRLLRFCKGGYDAADASLCPLRTNPVAHAFVVPALRKQNCAKDGHPRCW
jgi:hypothetical protein